MLMEITIGWTEIIVAAIPATLTLVGVWIIQSGKRDERREAREVTLETRMDKLERKLDEVQHHLRAEQRFSHRVVLAMYETVKFFRDEAAWRDRHRDDIPGDPPTLPDPDEIEGLLQQRPTYRARDEPN